MTNGDILFHYVPRSGGRGAWWLPIIPAVLVTIAAVQGRQGVPPKTLGMVIGITWLACGGLALLLRYLGKLFARTNVIQIDAKGVLFGSFGGIKMKAALPEVRRIEITRDRNMTKIWIEPKSGPKKLLMAFYGAFAEGEKKRFAAAAKKFGTECQTG